MERARSRTSPRLSLLLARTPPCRLCAVSFGITFVILQELALQNAGDGLQPRLRRRTRCCTPPAKFLQIDLQISAELLPPPEDLGGTSQCTFVEMRCHPIFPTPFSELFHFRDGATMRQGARAL